MCVLKTHIAFRVEAQNKILWERVSCVLRLLQLTVVGNPHFPVVHYDILSRGLTHNLSLSIHKGEL